MSSARKVTGSARSVWRSAPKQRRQTWRLTAGSTVVGLAVAAGAVATAGPWDSGQRTAERSRAAAQGRTGGEHHAGPVLSAAPVLAPLGGPVRDGNAHGVTPPAPQALADALTPLLDDPSLGTLRTASVVDVATGRELFGSRPDRAATPASTVKLATAAAALSALGPDHRVETRVVEGARRSGPPEIVLVGGGDPTLTARASQANPDESAPDPSPDQPASLRTLADDTARTLKQRGTAEVRLAYDATAFSGPLQHPIGPNENIATISPLMADEGRLDATDHGPAPRTADPAATAAQTFAGLLRDRGIKITEAPAAAKAPTGPTRLAAVRSLPVASMVERMLTNSDNDIAESLARLTALGTGEPASFEGAHKAVRKTLTTLGLPLTGAVFEDGSGLDRDDRVTARLLSRILVLAAAPDHPELRPILTGLPVASFTGTLRDRYTDRASGAGAVRAKTGTLTGVNTLAGTVVDTNGRLLAFAFMSTAAPDGPTAQSTLDHLATTLTTCTCH
ncbi:D-alanyl-D-alanine carboxypeptidase/D-alanyl-D-alanine-endopeptidase [Streptomyces sp. MST-110588]|uniref:D-alanyl-D-alanine carboxypeptidase/D-alanyl-D-alanine endopeptidase n=1 Tax=Streptomyces sp. MST-110588 TaxID=2833628 RepID=UPI001F5C9E27|nr:D-alanyl-D-alanine carboxypeptidase/D-alanyl-D-alanine-endopeptidase [Streptomyces sp. MST-110588]